MTEFSIHTDLSVTITTPKGWIVSKESSKGCKCYELKHLSGNGYFIAGFKKGTHLYTYYNCNNAPHYLEYGDGEEKGRIAIGVASSFPLMLCFNSLTSKLSIIMKNETYSYDSISTDSTDTMSISFLQGAGGTTDILSLNVGYLKFENNMPKGYSAWLKQSKRSCRIIRKSEHSLISVMILVMIS